MREYFMKYQPDYKYIPPLTWSILTPVYDFFCAISRLGSRFKTKVLNSAQLRDGMTVADIGCGTGLFLKIAKQRYPNVRFIGFDPDKKALGVAERRIVKAHLSVELKEAFAESLPLADQSIDICFSTLAFHHMPDSVKRGAIKEIYRVLKNDGTVIIADFGVRKGFLPPTILFFDKIEYIEGNFKGLIPRYMKDADFRNIRVVTRHFPGIDIVVAEK